MGLFDRVSSGPLKAPRKHVPLALQTRDDAHRPIRWEEDTPARANADSLGLGTRQRAVYDVIRHRRNVTNSEIAEALGWSINRVTPRTLELRERGLVVPADRRECRVTGSTVQSWRAA